MTTRDLIELLVLHGRPIQRAATVLEVKAALSSKLKEEQPEVVAAERKGYPAR